MVRVPQSAQSVPSSHQLPSSHTPSLADEQVLSHLALGLVIHMGRVGGGGGGGKKPVLTSMRMGGL